MADARPTDNMRQIAEAWEQAKAQLAELRDQVQKAGELANMKLQSALLEREEDKAYRDFGQAVWGAVQKGTLKLPSSLASAQKAMLELQRKKDAQNKEINDVLREGADVADRMKKASPKARPAGKTTKR